MVILDILTGTLMYQKVLDWNVIFPLTRECTGERVVVLGWNLEGTPTLISAQVLCARLIALVSIPSSKA